MIEKKGLFFDKRDVNYIELHSPAHFYEMFVRKKIKSDIIIPQTLIFTKGIPKLWLFNSSKAKTPIILKKNIDKLNLTEIGRCLIRVRNSDDFKVDSLTTLLEIAKKHDDTNPVVYVRYAGEIRKGLTKVELIKTFLDSKDKVISSLQDYVQNTSNEIYYAHYRQDESNLPVGYSFYKKSITFKQVLKQKRFSANEQQSPFQDIVDIDAPKSTSKFISEKEQVSVIFKFFDQRLNQNFTYICKSLVDFLEKAYRIKVKKMVAKFITDQFQQVYFLGLKELFIEVPKTSPYDVQKFKDDLRDSSNCSFENFQVLCKLYLRRNDGKKAFKFPQTIYEDEKEISAKLYKNLIVEKCCGDFCEYMMVEKNRGPLAIRKNILDDYKKHFGDKKMNEENFSVTLPYEISFQLILRTRECADEIIEIMKKNKIYSRTSNHHYTLEEYNQDFDANIEYPFKNFKREVYNMGNLYKNVKICKNCFIVYSLTSKYFDQRLKADLKHKDWRAQTANPTTMKPRESVTAPALTNNLLQPLETNQNSLIEVLEEVEDKPNKTTTQRLLKSAQSEQKFKIKKRIEPKLFKLYMPPKSALSLKPLSSTTSQPTLQHTRRQMDVIRLAMGFLNYDQRPKTQSVPRQDYSQNTVRKNQKPPSVRKALHLQESRAIQDFQSAKVSLKVGCSNETQMRGKLQNYYLNQQQQEPVQFLGLSSIYSYHSNFQHLRNITHGRRSTPAQVLQQNPKQEESYDFRSVCRISQVPYPPMSVPDLYLDRIEYFIYDECTAVPYLVLQNKNMHERSPVKERSDMVLVQGQNQVVMFTGDFFDNCFEYLQIFEESIEKLENTTIVMLNLPGQAYTVYDDQRTYDNLMLCDLLDRLIFTLDEKNTISSRSDNFKFIGVGMGGFIFQTFCCFAVSNIPFISGVLLVNSYADIDEMLKDTLIKSQEVFESCPKDMPELAYNYYSVIANSHQLEDDELKSKIGQNPISLVGRLTIINGCLNSQSAIQQFITLPLQVQIIHTLKTCIVNLSQTDILVMFQPDITKETSEKLVIKRATKEITKRNVQFVDGGHCLIDDNPKLLEQLFSDFLSTI